MTERTSLFLMANLGAEVERLLDALRRRDESGVVACIARADRMLAELRESAEMRERLSEIDALQMVIDDFRNEARAYDVEPEDLRNYFTPFALRLLRGKEQGKFNLSAGVSSRA